MQRRVSLCEIADALIRFGLAGATRPVTSDYKTRFRSISEDSVTSQRSLSSA
jgi:hypothetical protein